MGNSPPGPAHAIASHLLAIGAVSLAPDDPFTWASGIQAPIYCDNRLVMSHLEVRRAVADGFAALVYQHGLHPDVIVGTATAGIAHAAWLAEHLDLPMAYVRSKPKGHGRGNQVEGRVEPGQRVVVIEDLVSTGGSSLAVVEALREAGAEVEALLAIFTYGLAGSAERFAKAGVPFYTLTRFETLLAVAEEEGRLPGASIESLRAWQCDPQAWAAKR